MKTHPIILTLCSFSLIKATPSLTLYNDNFAIVRQQVPLSLASGKNIINFDAVTSQLEPNSVVLRPKSDGLEFSIYEQNYHNAPISQSLLLEQFVGKSIPFVIQPSDSSASKKVLGKVIRSGYTKEHKNQEPIIEIAGDLRFGLPGTPLFPSLGTDSILNPTLSWVIGSETNQIGEAELSYLSEGFSWSSDYNLIVDDSKSSARLNGWVTLNNSSGTAFNEAKVSLLAGHVNRTTPSLPEAFAMATSTRELKSLDDSPQVSQRSIDSYHIYNIKNRITLKDQQTKQIQFITSSQIKASKSYIYEPQKHSRFYGSPQTNKGQDSNFSNKVSIYWSFKNSTESGLGVPLPKGKIRLYQADGNSLEFLGDNLIPHTPQGETISFYTGEAFDLIGSRSITAYQTTKESISETIKLTIKNRSKERASIKINEALTRWHSWTIANNSSPYNVDDSHHISFTVDLEPDAEQNISYTVLYKWSK